MYGISIILRYDFDCKKILNKNKIRGVEKYLVCWQRFIVEHDTWEKEENLGNTREVVEKFEGRMSAEIRKQEKLDKIEEKNFRRRKLPGKYTAKILYG